MVSRYQCRPGETIKPVALPINRSPSSKERRRGHKERCRSQPNRLLAPHALSNLNDLCSYSPSRPPLPISPPFPGLDLPPGHSWSISETTWTFDRQSRFCRYILFNIVHVIRISFWQVAGHSHVYIASSPPSPFHVTRTRVPPVTLSLPKTPPATTTERGETVSESEVAGQVENDSNPDGFRARHRHHSPLPILHRPWRLSQHRRSFVSDVASISETTLPRHTSLNHLTSSPQTIRDRPGGRESS